MAFWIMWVIDAITAFGVLCAWLWALAGTPRRQPGGPNPMTQLFIIFVGLVVVMFAGLAMRKLELRWVAYAVVALPTAAAVLAGLFAVYRMPESRR